MMMTMIILVQRWWWFWFLFAVVHSVMRVSFIGSSTVTFSLLFHPPVFIDLMWKRSKENWFVDIEPGNKGAFAFGRLKKCRATDSPSIEKIWGNFFFLLYFLEPRSNQCLTLSVPPCHFLSFLFLQMILPVDGCWLSAGSYSLRLYCQLFFHMLCLGSFCLLWRFCQGVQSVQSVWRSFRFEFCLHIWSFTPRPHTKRHHVICACEYFPVFMSAPKQQSLWLNRLSTLR